MGSTDYRQRIFGSYVTTALTPLAPHDLAGLAPRRAQLRRLVLTTFPPSRHAKILDLGCGHGALLHVARECGYVNVMGIDRSREQVQAAQELGISGVVEGDVFDFLSKQPRASYDAFVAFDLIEHFHKGELIDLLDEIHQTLSPGGRLVIHTPNAVSPFFGRVRYGDVTHELAFTPASMAQLLRATGFSGLRFIEDSPAVHGPTSALRALLWHLMRATIQVALAIETGDTTQEVLSQNMTVVAQV
jgi:2-polyprenyl-3-methyl-5-hydroxy-6-metoxy-1,4-benzoquinol methylase